jgi:TolB-like protein
MADAVAVHRNVTAEGSAPYTEADVRAQLDRIRSSLEFDVSARGRKFLSYIVEETLAGRADRIKAYSIAVEVFGRDASFDAQTDPAVRIEAARIRRALERYYFTAGRDDPIVITMPKGGYVPAFQRIERQPQAEEAATTIAEQPVVPPRSKISRAVWSALAALIVIIALAAGYRLLPAVNRQEYPAASVATARPVTPDVPGLLVEPFEDLSGTPGSAIVARGLVDEVVGQIAKFKDIVVVVGRAESASGEAPPEGSKPVRYVLQGSVRIEDDKFRLTTRLVNRADGSVVWADSYDESLKVHELLETEADVARKVATAIAQPYGIIFRADAARSVEKPPDDWDAYACTLAYYAYRADLRPETHASVKQCLERAVGRFPNCATAWALLSRSPILTSCVFATASMLPRARR